VTDDLEAVRRACDELIKSKAVVTFAAVAERAGISRATLYRNRALRQVVDEYRDPTGEMLTVSSLATQVDHLRQALEIMSAKLRRHDDELRQLRRVTRQRSTRGAIRPD
jgi:AcrR family transcriptional regulator